MKHQKRPNHSQDHNDTDWNDLSRDELARESYQMSVILAALDTGMVLIDRELNVVWMNAKLRKMIPHGDPIGQKCFTFSEDRTTPCEGCGALMAFADGEAHKTRRRTDGPSRAWHYIVSQPIKDENGEVVQVLESVTDVTDRVAAEEDLKVALAEVSRLRDQLEAENIYLQREIQAASNFEEMIGESKPIKYVWHRISEVAPTTTTVFIEGETGVGKELVARAIHGRSPRRKRPLIKVNCAAMSTSLIESELFGHEKGAFTGAIQRRRGHFELADGGTLFLDEISELPLEIQAKLLSVLEDGMVSRVGSEKGKHVDVRLITATNRCLADEVEAGRFRRDLFYRLNVYPITVPPLRDRPEDIPLLVHHFLHRFSSRQGKTVDQIPVHVMNRITRHPWMGNIRELKNVLESAVVAARDEVVGMPPLLQKNGGGLSPGIPGDESQSLDEIQRRHIMRVLDRTGGKVEGSGGAAEILQLKPSTLRNRMSKLGIKWSRPF
jgi:transcriptional regulator with GAF, ATPase, and Fis domain